MDWVWAMGIFNFNSFILLPVLPVIHFTCTCRRPKLKILGVGRHIWGVGRQSAMRMRMNIQDTPYLRSIYFKHIGADVKDQIERFCSGGWF